MLSCATAERMIDTRMTKPKLALYWPVNVAVCVRKPGPIADVAIRNAAPKSAPLLFFFSLMMKSSCSGKVRSFCVFNCCRIQKT